MKNVLSIIGSLLLTVSFLPYLIQTTKGKVKPRIASWASWALIGGIVTIAELSNKVYTSALLTGCSAVISLTVFIFALRAGDKTYQLLDGVCQLLSLIGLVAWIVSKNPYWAIVFNMLADVFASIPTLYHSWVAPHEEAYHSFFVFGAGAFISIFGVQELTFINAAFPIYFSLTATLLGLTILVRQKMVQNTVY